MSGAPLLLAACSGEAPREEEAPTTAAAPAPAPAATEATTSPDAGEGRAYRYTSLVGCELLRENREEGGFFETMCPGLGGYRLRLTESDLRQNLAIVAADGGETDLALGRIGGGGFSSLGPTAEWRGPAGEPFAPDSLIVRYRVAEKPHPEPETAYLLAIDLGPRACVVARVAPGPAQNDIARARADDPGACL